VGVKKVPRLNPRSVRTRVGAIAPVRWLVSTLSVVLVLITATFVGTNLITAIPPGASPITVTFNYNGATGGNTLASATVTPGASADSVLPFPTKSGLDFSGWFNPQSLLNGQRITTIGEADAGELLAGFVPPELAQTLNLDPPPPPTCANGLAVCALGDTGPGGGLVFYDAGSVRPWGQYLEMAPKTWSGAGTPDAKQKWCSTTAELEGTFGTLIGTGSANTDLMLSGTPAACTSGAAVIARAYAGGGLTDWFLPSRDELNAMCNYSRTWTGTPSNLSDYGFASDTYWSSSQNGVLARYQSLGDGLRGSGGKNNLVSVRPIRAF
jgi:hypothetical protein